MAHHQVEQVPQLQKEDEKVEQQEKPFLIINNIPIHFDEDWNTGIGGGLWTTGIAMGKYFQQHTESVRQSLQKIIQLKKQEEQSQQTQEQQDDRQGLSVLELGSGNGFLSVCFYAMAKDLIKELTITDLDDHLNLMEKTLLGNSHIFTPDDDNNTTTNTNKTATLPTESEISSKENNNHNCNNDDNGEIIHEERQNKEEEQQEQQQQRIIRFNNSSVCVMEHKWGEKFNKPSKNVKNVDGNSNSNNNENNDGYYDFIFGSDLVYYDELYEPYIKSLLQLCYPRRTIVLLGVTMKDTKPTFFHLLKKYGFTYTKLSDYLLSSEYVDSESTFGLFVITKL